MHCDNYASHLSKRIKNNNKKTITKQYQMVKIRQSSNQIYLLPNNT